MILTRSQLFDFFESQRSSDVEKSIEYFKSLTSVLFTVIQALHENNETVEYFQQTLEAKYVRFGIANYSLMALLQKHNLDFNGKSFAVVDSYSLSSIARLQMESFLTMYYLFYDDIPTSEKNFRFNVYKLHGLNKQYNFQLAPNYKDKHGHLDRIKNELEEIISQIKASEYFINATQKQKGKYLNPKRAKMLNTQQLFEISGLGRQLNTAWQVYSNHAHAEYIADRQHYAKYRDLNKINESNSLIITTSSILTSKLVLLLANSFDGVKKKLNIASDFDKFFLEYWNQLNIG